MDLSTSPIIEDDDDETIASKSADQADNCDQNDTIEFINKTKCSSTIIQTDSNSNSNVINNTTTTIRPNIIIPNINIHHGPPPPKRNVAVKNTSAHLNRNNQITNSINIKNNLVSKISAIKETSIVQAAIRVNEDEIMSLEDKDTDSNDDYIPPKNMRDESELSDSTDETSSTKRKSTRLIKKPKILEEFVIDSDNNSSNQEAPKVNTTSTSRITIEPNIKLTESESQSKPKSTARKSTAPLTTSNLNQFNIQRQQIRPTITQTQSSTTLPVTTQTNGNLSCLITNTKPNAKPIQNGNSNNILTSKSQSTNTQITATATSASTSVSSTTKQYRNKMVSCKPFYQTKATECHPIVKDASTQIDLDEIKLSHTVVPVPVPINVPVPMCMYQAPMPIPILIPVPIPVPVFIPTTKKTFDRVQRKIRKLRKKLPSDPYEFEILLYAEKLAREEGVPGFEDSSDGESDTETNKHQNGSVQYQDQQLDQLQLIQNETEGSFKWNIGVKAFNTWLANKLDQVKLNSSILSNRLPNDLLKLKNEELNLMLAEFLNEVRKPNGEIYAPESIYYICLGIQYYLQEKSRVENIFLDSHLFDQFQEALNEIASRYKIRLDPDGLVTSRIEEEILWESKQLGAYSPFVLLNTILYFNTKYFFLDKVESHKKLSFTNVKKHSKRNIGPNGEDYGKTVFLRYYPDFHGLEQVIYEQGENYDNPLRCPVELYNFYLSKCPESVKNRSDVFYLLPEKASLPSSPVWFSSQPLGDKMLERMLNRIKMVKEVNELLIAAAPATSSLIVQ